MAKTNKLDFSNDLKGLLDETVKIKTPVQKIIAVSDKEEEKLFALQIPTSLFKKLKMLSVEKEISLKQLLLDAAIEKYFS